MSRDEELRMLVEEFVHAMQEQTRLLESLVEHLGPVAGRLPEETDLSVIGSQLTGLRARAKKLVSTAHGGK
jgi:hypothetical protein